MLRCTLRCVETKQSVIYTKVPRKYLHFPQHVHAKNLILHGSKKGECLKIPNLHKQSNFTSLRKYSALQRMPSYPIARGTCNERLLVLFLQQNDSVAFKGTVSHTSTNSLENPLAFRDSEFDVEQYENIIKRFPHPKNILHSFYDVVSMELKQPRYKVSPQFKVGANRKGSSTRLWCCTYRLLWPSEMVFQSQGVTKQEASYRTAVKALEWLNKLKKLSRDGRPLVYDKEQLESTTKKSYIRFILNDMQESNLSRFAQLYESHVQPCLEQENEKYISESESDPENSQAEQAEVAKNEFAGLSRYCDKIERYLAKEDVRLPISDCRSQLEEVVEKNRVVIIKGEPGCGKSTRVPQYLLDQWARQRGSEPCRIMVTQPRRIAAISLANRVASERQENLGHIVGYQVRLNSVFNQKTGRILYCTTGILLHRLQRDSALLGYTHIVLDEAHERDINTDLLMTLLRHTLQVNPDLKLIIMSATVDVNLFQNYFDQAPVLQVPGFTYPVKVNFLEDIKLKLEETEEMCLTENPRVVCRDVAKVIEWVDKTRPEGAVLCFLPGWEEITQVKNALMESPRSNERLVLPLHSRISDREQYNIFSRPPPGIRKIILATNIAETSITVDDVVYVIDTGIYREERFDAERGIKCIDCHWISQSNMNQRKGRAGRVQAGESFHLYKQSKYLEMDEHMAPEILKVSLAKTVLDTKAYSNNMLACEFYKQLPTPPDDLAIAKAVEDLTNLEMLDKDEKLTPLGRVCSEFQLTPKLSKALINSVIYKCTTPLVDIVTLYSTDSDIFLNTLLNKSLIKEIKKEHSDTSDHLAVMRIFQEWNSLIEKRKFQMAEQFCEEYCLIPARLHFIKKLRELHQSYLYDYLNNAMDVSNKHSDNEELIKGVLLSGVGSILLYRTWDFIKGRLKKTKTLINNNGHKATITSDSINSQQNHFSTPFLVYINETRSMVRRITLIRESSLIDPLTVLLFKKGDIDINKAPEDTQTKYDIQNPVILTMSSANIQIVCDREQAKLVQKCKQALTDTEKYLIYQLTSTRANHNETVVDYWNDMLVFLSKALSDTSNST